MPTFTSLVEGDVQLTSFFPNFSLIFLIKERLGVQPLLTVLLVASIFDHLLNFLGLSLCNSEIGTITSKKLLRIEIG